MVATLAGTATPAHAFTTRVHMVLANQVREALIASPDQRTIPLRWSGEVVRLSDEDAMAIIAEPIAFRGGAIGPDNVVFPAMTDGTHGVEQDPYRLCQMLYDDALNQVERAYALGCFLHGASDAIAHHYVNYMTGETFTLNPLSASRASDFSNVIGHIVTESIIQEGVLNSDPTAMSGTRMDHAIPTSFVLRNYFDTRAILWQTMATHSQEKYDLVLAGDPRATVTTIATTAGFAGYEQLIMAPRYLARLESERMQLREAMVDEITRLQAPPLSPTPGADGVLGTSDDDTACAASCATEAATYYVFVNLLEPRVDGGGSPLPSAFDKVSDELGNNVSEFLPALVETITNISAQLNTPIDPTDMTDHGFDLDPADVVGLIAPMQAWATRTAAIDFETLGMSVEPAWYTRLTSFLTSIGIDLRIADIIRAFFEPYIAEIREAIIMQVTEVARGYLEELAAGYIAQRDAWIASNNAVLDASTPAGLDRHALDDLFNSGLWNYSFNFAAATFGNHELLLTASDPIANGPASFDASYTHYWSQAGLCGYLQDAIFPQGLGMEALLTIEEAGTFHPAVMPENSPFECHDGALDMFGAANTTTCAHTDLVTLVSTMEGSMSRAYPPELASGMPMCNRITVPGLPEPPPLPDGGVPTGDGGTGDGGSADGGMDTTDGGCGCSAPGKSNGGAGLGLLLLGLLGLIIRRRRVRLRRVARTAKRAAPSLAAAALLLLAIGCDPGTMEEDGGPPTDDGGGMDADTDAGDPMIDSGADGDVPTDAPDLRRELLDRIGVSVWHGLQTRTEGALGDRERMYEQHFDASRLEWVENRNPFGPSQQRVLRSMIVLPDGSSVESTVMIPGAWGCPGYGCTPATLNGDREAWTMEIMDGTPRTLRLTNTGTGAIENYEEGPAVAPTDGLTAELRVFGAGGIISDGFCTAGSTLGSERTTVFDFARGVYDDSPTSEVLGRDVVAGSRHRSWEETGGDFAVTDVSGFEATYLGGTVRSDTNYFTVRYTGTIAHPGGSFCVREDDDELEDAAWVFMAGYTANDPFLEVHNWVDGDACQGEDPDCTLFCSCPEEPCVDLPAGDVEIEVILVHCMMALTTPMRVQVNVAGGGWQALGDATSSPVINDTYFPPAM